VGKQELTFDCVNCETTVVVEFGTYRGGPFAYDDYAKCNNCGREYTNQIEIDNLVRAKRALTKKNSNDKEPA